MAGLCVARRLTNGISRFGGFSALSRRWNSSATCVIRGEKGDIAFPGEMFETLADHEARFPLLKKIPDGEIIEVDPARPFLIDDHWRPILFSGFVHSKICKSQNDCIVDAFDYSNVGVLKELNVLAFKKFNRQEGSTNVNHNGYSTFVKKIFNKLGGITNLREQFKECGHLLDGCDTGVDDDLLGFSSFFLNEEELANLYCDAHRLLRHQFKHRNKGLEAKRILNELELCFSNQLVVRACLRHKMFKFHLGSHCPRLKIQKLSRGEKISDFRGTTIVDVHRIAVTHAIEDKLMGNVLDMYPQLKQLWYSFSRADVIRALRYMFPLYPDKVLQFFDNNGLVDYLQMKRRLPTPSIYKYATPDEEGPQGGAGIRTFDATS